MYGLWNQISFSCLRLQVAAKGFTGHNHIICHMVPKTHGNMKSIMVSEIELNMLAVSIQFKDCITLMLDTRLSRNGKNMFRTKQAD